MRQGNGEEVTRSSQSAAVEDRNTGVLYHVLSQKGFYCAKKTVHSYCKVTLAKETLSVLWIRSHRAMTRESISASEWGATQTRSTGAAH
jgi:hypothetical protein